MKTKEFTKADLEAGMMVKTRDGCWNKVELTDEGFELIDAKGDYFPMSFYNNNLQFIGDREYDIMLVYSKLRTYACSTFGDTDTRDLLYEREVVKEVTMAEVYEKFGCEVKIVKE